MGVAHCQKIRCLNPLCLSVGLLHGDMSQGDRDQVIMAFKKKEFPTLVASDVAGECVLTYTHTLARTLGINYVSNFLIYCSLQDIQTHTHTQLVV